MGKTEVGGLMLVTISADVIVRLKSNAMQNLAFLLSDSVWRGRHRLVFAQSSVVAVKGWPFASRNTIAVMNAVRLLPSRNGWFFAIP